MRAAIGVVLRRDLSLSRRLYAWLLGKGESSDEQTAYLGMHGLDVLTAAMKVRSVHRTCRSPAHSAAQTDLRPYSDDETLANLHRALKVFISLLDKWEIGSALTQRVVLHTLDLARQSNASSVMSDEVRTA